MEKIGFTSCNAEVDAVQLRRCLYMALVLVQPCSSQTVSKVAVTSNNKSSADYQHVEVGFKLCQGYLIVVQGTLGTLEGQNLLVDTGANITSIGRRIARKLSLTGQHAKLALLGEVTDVERVLLPNLRIGSLRAESLPVLVQDLVFVERACRMEIDAIVGLDFLGQSSFAVDYESKKILFGPIETVSPAVPFEWQVPMAIVKIDLNGQPLRLLLDTGTPNLLLFDRHLPASLRNFPTDRVRLSFNSASTPLEMRQVIVSMVQLGTTNFGVRKALLAAGDSHFEPSLDGALGPASLHLKWVGFDFEHRRLNFKR